MLNRVIKVITNKPTTIDKPVFTKKFNENNKQIEELEKLLEQATEDSKRVIKR